MSEFYQKTGAPAVGGMPGFIKLPGQSVQATGGKMTTDSGEINASSVKELTHRISALHSLVASGEVAASNPFETQEARKVKLHAQMEKKEAFISAFNSNDDQMKVFATVYATDLWETLNRQGFTDVLMARKDVPQGQPNQIPIRRKDVVAFQVDTDGEGITQVVEQNYFYPKEYNLQAHVVVEEGELAMAGPDFLDNKFQDSLEAIMVRQDKLLRQLFLSTVGGFNAPLSFPTLTPQVLSAARTQVMSNGIPAAAMLFSFDLWDDMIAGNDFNNWWEPVHKYQLIMEGRIGTLLGMKMITDGFRYETLKVLEQGEMFIVGPPSVLGIRTVRSELKSREFDTAMLGAARRGFFLWGRESMILSSDRAVQFSSRV